MKIYRMDDFRISIRTGRAAGTGIYEITRLGTRREVLKYAETYKTAGGEYPPEEWRQIVQSCIEASGSGELLERIIGHCRTHCAWLKTDRDCEEYALEILVSRAYRHWKDFPMDGLTEGSAFVFIFPKEDVCGGM